MIYQTKDLTPALMVKNEDFWIWYVLRDLFRVFGRAFVVDTGSTDRTKEIVRAAAKFFDGDLTLHEMDYGDNAELIGNSRNVMRQSIKTEWMFKVDGDEIWPEDQLQALLATDISDNVDVVMVKARNLGEHKGAVLERDSFSADVLFRPHIYWHKKNYPFEGYDQPAKVLHYAPAWYWHTRHLVRSSKDSEAFARDMKRGYFPWDGPLKKMPPAWLGELGPYPNPYLGVE